MIFDMKTPGGGRTTVEVKPHPKGGTREDWRDGGRKLRRYVWSMNAFTGQHGDPFGEFFAANIDEAHDIARNTARRILQRKKAYEKFYDRCPGPPGQG